MLLFLQIAEACFRGRERLISDLWPRHALVCLQIRQATRVQIEPKNAAEYHF